MLTTGILGKLHRDHQAVLRLTTDINEHVDAGSGGYARLFVELRNELRAHFAAEEAVLYGELDQHAEHKDDVRDGREEHEEIEEILADLERCEDEEEWLSTFQELEEAIEHHVREVEGAVFAAALRAFGKERLQELAEAYLREKARARAELTGRDDEDDEEPDDERGSRDSLSA